MADDLNDLGSYSIFPVDVNWAKKLNRNLELARIIHRRAGTANMIDMVSDVVPWIVEVGVTPMTKQEEYDVIDFFSSRKGALGGFWLKVPVQEFELKEDISSGSSVIYCYRNNAHLVYQGHERIWIAMNDGDILTFQVTDTVVDESNDRLDVVLNTVTDRDLTTTNHWLIGRLLFCRFTESRLPCMFNAALYPDIKFNVTELPMQTIA